MESVSDEAVQEALEVFGELATNMVRYCDGFFAEGAPGKDFNDDFELVVIAFLMKQHEHLRSLVVLVEHGQLRDTQIIARTMLEGMATLAWIHESQEKRSKLWRYSLGLSGYKIMRDKEDKGIQVEVQEKKFVTWWTENHSHIFEGKKGRLFEKWHVEDKSIVKIKSFFESMPVGKELHETYEYFSRWSHWVASGAMEGVGWRNDKTVFLHNDNRYAVNSLAIGTESLLSNLVVACRHLDWSIEQDLLKFRERFQFAAKIAIGVN